jgi:23S rRNA pseudouridine1911/1915/1917 synthase
MVAIVFEDEWIVAVDKPAGLPTAPLPGKEGPSLVALLIESHPEIAGLPGRKPWEPGLLHRLDTATSGLVLFARSAEAMEALMRSQDGGLFAKEYAALCSRTTGKVSGSRPESGEIDDKGIVASRFRPYGPRGARVAAMGVGLAWPGPIYRTKVSESGAKASDRAFMRAKLSRGYRHQIRVHLSWIGFPIVGDELYHPRPSGRLMLHACALEFPHPATGRTERIETPPPAGFEA